MTEAQIIVRNETGLHSRPADLFVRTAKLYSAAVTVHKGQKSADAKNILKVILLNVSQGDSITIRAEGVGEEDVIAELVKLVDSDFTEVNPAVTI